MSSMNKLTAKGRAALAKVRPVAKAIVAFLTPAALAILAAMQDETPGGSAITASEWVAALVASLTVSGFVYGTPNTDPRGLKQEQSVQPPEFRRGGHTGVPDGARDGSGNVL